jgi:predicted Zn-dependent protease
VVASIDALLARAETRSSKPARARIEAPAALTPRAEVWTPELRARTQAALAQGDPDGAMAMLTQAGQREPASAEALAQAAAQALRLGELGHAVPLARRALLHDPAHAGARQTLAQGLAAQHAATGTIPAATTDASTHASATATATRSAAAQRPWGALN